jgi:uncharacterized protein YjbJ (UPF0337 family)
MNWDQIQGNWKQIKGLLVQKWGKLADDDLAVAHGNRHELEGRIQERYGIAKEVAQRQVDEFLREYEHKNDAEVATVGDPVTSADLKQNI